MKGEGGAQGAPGEGQVVTLGHGPHPAGERGEGAGLGGLHRGLADVQYGLRG